MAAVMGMQGGLLNDPRWLAAGAGGLVSAIAVMWAVRGLPVGFAAFWLAPFPIFAAGLSAGPAAALGALGVAAALLWFLANIHGLLIYLAVFGVPAAAMVLVAFRGGAIDAGRALAFLGLWPAALVLGAAFLAAGEPGGLEGVLRRTTEATLSRIGMSASEIAQTDIVRVKAAAIAFWFTLALAINGAWAQGFLANRGWSLAPSPARTEARMPIWYAAMPLIAAGGWLLAPSGADTVPLSVLLVTLLPVFLAGLAAVHRVSRGRPARPVLLTGFYLGLILLSLPAMAAVTGFGIYDQWGRRHAPPGGNT